MAPRSFRSILIANRGEIALRITRTARRLGYRVIAVYSDADRDAPHCRAADVALHIGAAQPSASYLNIAALLEAARSSGAEAVHPGYGFLAESEDFAQACADSGLVFIGPPPGAIRDMGNKAGAKRIMAVAGVPCVPGYQGEDQSDARMAQEAANIGYPVMIKAAAGGGGRGMRRVERAEDFAAALQSARSEALNAFSSGELILEKAIVEPRHIEVQVFADAHGNVVHLGERDCSVQRRHQKLIEESPSPVVTPELRQRMGEVSVAAARVIGYVGAGTLEFLLDREGQFYFMEMNTRLQVEHAVTECVVGVDLVEWQLRVAGGEALPLSQQEIDARRAGGGHAIEVRLCAEDPAQDFLPQSGTVARWRTPGEARTDHALEDGLQVSPFYDSMLAKIVAHGQDRADALRRLSRALEDCLLLGVRTNRRFLAQCIAHPEFIGGRATTAFIETHLPASVRSPATATSVASAGHRGGTEGVTDFAALLLASRRQAAGPRYPAELQGWSNSESYPHLCHFLLDGQPAQAYVRATVLADDGKCMRLQSGGRTIAMEYAQLGDQWHIVLDGVEYVLRDTTYARAERNGCAAGNGRITAPMNGRVTAVHVAQGDQVAAGQPLLVIEAMKMEHSVVAQVAGQVEQLGVRVGDQVAPGALLAEITPASAERG
jgi:geranyl-CoA carboxylase alpha subunit